MNQQLVVVQLLPELDNGGVERGTVEVANYLAQNNCMSIVISAGGRLVKNLDPNVLHIKLNIGKKSVFIFNLIKPLTKIFKKYNIDIVHARSRLPAWLAYRVISKFKGAKPKFITTIHGLYSVKRYSSIMARGDQVIAVSQTSLNYVIDNYNKYLKSPPKLIYRGIDPEEFPYNYQPSDKWMETWFNKHPNLVNKKIVLLPGRLSKLKGAKDLLCWLKSSNDECRLVLTSKTNTNEDSKELYNFFAKHQVSQKVVWIGLQSSMAEIYAMADLVVSTSNRPESFGRTVLEALSIGTQVVAYNHGGVGEILDSVFPEGKVELGNENELSNKINQLLEHPRIVPNKKPFLLSTMLNNTLSVYREIMTDG